MPQGISTAKLSINLIFLTLFTYALARLNLGIIEKEIVYSEINPIVFANLFLILIVLSASLAQLNMNIPIVTFWSFEYVFFGFTVFSIAVDNNPLYLNSLSGSKYFDIAITVTFVSHLLFSFVQFLNFKKVKSKLPLRSSREADTKGIQRCKIIFYIYFASYPILLSQLGGAAFLFRRARSSSISADYSSPMFSIAEAILYVTPVLLTLFVEQQRHLGVQVLSKYKLYVLYLTLVILSNPLANARQTTILILFPFIYRIIYKNYGRAVIFFYTLLFSSFFLANIVNRQTGSINGLYFEAPSRLGDYDAFGQLMSTLQFIDINGISYLKQLSGSIFFFIPRNIWESKPVDSGVLIANFNSLSFQNLSCPWIAEAILNFGIIGLFVLSITMSFLLKRLNSSYEFNYMFGAFISSMLFIVLRGSLLQATGKLVYGLFLIFVISNFCLSKRVK